MISISRTQYEALQAENAELSKQVRWLMEQIRLNRQKRFGSSSEKSQYDSLDLFNEAEVTANEKEAEPELTEIQTHYRKKAKQSSDRLPEDLPVEIIEHSLEDDSCPTCAAKLHVMGKKVRRELKLIPARAVIVEHIHYVYSCRNCEKNGIAVPVLKAPALQPVIAGSFASPEAVAHLMTQKFAMGLPLYRQEQEWRRMGIELSRQTMSNWLLRCAEDWLEPIYRQMQRRLCEEEILHADETVLQVLHEPGKAAQSKSYMWVYRTGSETAMPLILFDYQPDRKAKRPQEFLKDFQGYLHTDGYGGYQSLPDTIVTVGCWADARRKFDEALKSIPEKDRQGSGAAQGKRYCDELFAIERKLSECTTQERHTKRQELAKPVLDEFLSYLHTSKASTKSGFGRAVHYTLNQWKYLERYLLDGRLEISNNRAERSVKPFVIDRKNFLFANTPRGAKASAIIFSLIETAKENGLNPYTYLTYIFKEAPNLELQTNPDAVNKLLPSAVPKSCKANAVT
ncbi:MAG: IS66 family transposase [Smithella sp.]